MDLHFPTLRKLSAVPSSPPRAGRTALAQRTAQPNPGTAQDDSAPISLEDPWWVKLLGIKSGKKAVVKA